MLEALKQNWKDVNIEGLWFDYQESPCWGNYIIGWRSGDRSNYITLTSPEYNEIAHKALEENCRLSLSFASSS